MQFGERRKGTRVPVARRTEFRLARRLPVRVVDISADGTLVTCAEPVAAGTRARFRVALTGEQFEAAVEIQRTHGRGEAPGLVAAKIVSVDEASRAVLDRFLRRAP